MRKNIHEALSNLLTKRLQHHLSSGLDSEKCTEIYRDIFDTVLDVFKESGIEVSNEAINAVSQMYYDSVKVNSNQDLDPNIFTQRAKIESISTKELAMMGSFFSGTPFGDIFIAAVKRRQ